MESVFGAILRKLVEGHPEIIGAVFAAWDGETVDLYHRESDGAFDVMALGAHFGIMVKMLEQSHKRKILGYFGEIIITTDRAIYIVVPVDGEYYIGLWSTAGAPLGWAKRRLDSAVTDIRKEM
jgi:hypothetical protein